MLKLIHFLRGYVRIRVSGFAPERFMNLCSVHEIELWNIVSKGYEYEMDISVSDYFKLKPIVRKTRTKVVLLHKRGLPFRIRKWKKRKVFLLGLFFCIMSLYAVSLFLWDIQLVQEGRLTQDMLLQFLQDNNITYGSYINGIDIDSIEKKLRDEYPFILWTSFHLEGTRLYVEVKENSQSILNTDTIARAHDPCDLCATVNGTVENIITRSGVPRVKAGDEIKKGDTLISGQVPVLNDDQTVRNYMYVHSDADIDIRTDIQYWKSLPFKYKKKVYTNNKKTSYYFRIHKQSFSLGSLPKYKDYDIVTDLKQAKLLSDFYLPLYYGKIVYHEYNNKDFIYTEDEAKIILQYNLNKFCETLQEKGIQIIENNVKIRKIKQTMEATGKITVLMRDGDIKNISVEEQIPPEDNADTEETDT